MYKVVSLINGRRLSTYATLKGHLACPKATILEYTPGVPIRAPIGSAGIFLLSTLPRQDSQIFACASVEQLDFPVEVWEVETNAPVIYHTREELERRWNADCGEDYLTCMEVVLTKKVKTIQPRGEIK